MKRILLAALVAAIPSTAFAQAQVGMVGYAEGSIGAAFIQTISTKPFTGVVGTDTYSGVVDLDYSPQLAAGAELGIAYNEFRFGISYDYVNATLDKATFAGTVDDIPFGGSVTKSELDSVGVSVDTKFQVVSANVYYSLPMVGAIRPYIGVGAGVAIPDKLSTEFAANASLGFRYAVSNDIYLGARYRITRVSQSSAGVTFDPVYFHTLSAVIGVYIN
jgi:opacity protein-like surface antigen